jgi:hypothetical protein
MLVSRRRYLATVFAYLLIWRSLPSNGSSCNNIKENTRSLWCVFCNATLSIMGSCCHVSGIPWLTITWCWIGWLDLLTPAFTTTLNHNQLQRLTINHCLRLAPFWLDCDCLLFWSSFYCDWLGSHLRITHFCFANEFRMNPHIRLSYEWMNESQIRVRVTLRRVVYRQ